MRHSTASMLATSRRVTVAFVAACMSFAPTASVYVLTKYAAGAVSAAFVASMIPSRVLAQMTIAEAQALGNLTGRTEKAAVVPPSSDPVNNTVTINSNNPSVNNTTFSINDLFSGASAPANGTSLSSSSAVYGNTSAMGVQSQAQVGSLMDPSNNSDWSNAYKTLRNSVITNPTIKADLRTDPALANTQAIAASADLSNNLGGVNANCTTSTATDMTKTVHLADMQSCTLYTPVDACLAQRQDTSTIPATGTLACAAGSTGNGTTPPSECKVAYGVQNGTCVDPYLGMSFIRQVTNHSVVTDCIYAPTMIYSCPSGYELNGTSCIRNSAASQKVLSFTGTFQTTTTLTTTVVTADGLPQTFTGPDEPSINNYYSILGLPTSVATSNGGTHGVLSIWPFKANGPVDPASCTYSAVLTNVTFENWFFLKYNVGAVAVFTNFPSTANNFMVQAFVELSLASGVFNPVSPVDGTIDIYASNCASTSPSTALVLEVPKSCTSSTLCTAQPVAWTSTGSALDLASTEAWQCFDVAGTTSSDPASTPTYPGEPLGPGIPLCFQAKARNYQCQSPGSSIPLTACDALKARPECVKTSEGCRSENMDYVTNTCLATTYEYDCGHNEVITSTATPVTNISCGGPVRCMGDSCIEEPPKESNPDFMQAAMALNMASWATNDQDCSTGSCYVFKGDGYSCKTAFFGVQDCCQTPTGLSIASYITAIYYTYKMSDKAAIMKFMDSNGMGAAVDAYKGIADWTTATYDKISTAVTTNVQSVLGTAGGPGAAPTLSATFSQLESQMISQLYDWTSSAFGPALADSLFGAPGAGAAGSGVASGPAAEFASTGAGQAIQMVGTVFMYYQMFVLAVQMIWPCEPREFELAVKKEMRSCHELGDFCASSFLGICYLTKKSFCCFKSPLARIINEQLRLHGATPWAAPSDQPSCPGVSMADFAVIDWSQIDLSEWVALLQTSNLMPTGAASADALYNMQKITTNQTVSGPQGTGALDKSTIGMSTAQPSDATQYVRGSLWGPLP